jgi:YD repeat-containing protein
MCLLVGILFSYIDAGYTEGVYNRILRTKQIQPRTLTNLSHEQSFSNTQYALKQLSDIYFTNGKVHFSYVNDRQDIPSAGRLDAIIIYKKTSSSSYTEIKRYQLVQDYFSCRDEASRADFNPSRFSHSPTSPLLKRLRFKSIEEIPVVGVVQNTKYSLEYYDNLPLPIHYSMSQDYWGYYNAANNSINLLVWDTNNLNILPNISYGANRNPDLTYAVLGSLKSITYPTKGKSEFAYELNNGPDNKAAGGLRIQGVTSYDNSGNKTGEKTYSYLKPYYISNVYGGDLNNLVLSTRLNYLVAPCECNVNSQQLTETIYNEEVGLVLGGSSSVAYEEVEEYTVDYTAPSNRLGKTFYKFSDYLDYDARPIPNMSINYSWKRGHLLEKWNYQKVGPTETIISKEINTYQSFNLPYRASQLSVYQTFLFINCESTSVPICRQSNPRCENLPEGVKIADEYSADFLHQNAESILLVSSEQISYDDNGMNPISSKNDFEYADFPYTQSNKTTHINSDGKVFTTKTKYPYHLGIMPYTEMVTKRIVAPSIESTDEMDNVQQSKVVNNYQKLGSIFTISSIQTQLKSTDSLTTEITFTNYDTYGNPLSWVKDGITTDLTYYNDSDYGKIRLVKEKIVNGQATFFDYEPLFGLKEIKLPNNIQTSYKYDGLGRLLNVKDHNGNLTDHYRYVYSTTAPHVCAPPIAPSISISLSNLCNVTLTASGCSGTVNWSNGEAGSSINVSTKFSSTYSATCTVDGCTSSASNGLIVPVLPTSWNVTQIGTPPVSDCITESSGTWTIKGSGNTFGASDNFSFVNRSVSGNTVIVAKLNSMSANSQGMRSGIMLRASNSPTADYFQFIFDIGNQMLGLYEQSSSLGGDHQIRHQTSSLPIWLRLKKNGNEITVWHSQSAYPSWNNDGDWTLYTTVYSTAFGSGFLMGLLAYNNDYTTNSLLNQTQFSNVSINNF